MASVGGVTLSAATVRVLARCNGYAVSAGGEVIGSVETPVFSGTKLRPDYLIVRLGEELRELPPEAIVSVDAASHTLFVDTDGL